MRRMRRRYEARREALLEALERWLARGARGQRPAGMFELVELPGDVDEAALLARAAKRGVGMEGLSLHRFTPGGPPGLVLGYGNLAEPAIEQGVRLMAEALAEVRG